MLRYSNNEVNNHVSDRRSVSLMNATMGSGIKMQLNDIRQPTNLDFTVEGTEKIKSRRSGQRTQLDVNVYGMSDQRERAQRNTF